MDPWLFGSSLGTKPLLLVGARVTKPGAGRSRKAVESFRGGLCPDQNEDRAAEGIELAAE
jgi:hypothetical protein